MCLIGAEQVDRPLTNATHLHGVRVAQGGQSSQCFNIYLDWLSCWLGCFLTMPLCVEGGGREEIRYPFAYTMICSKMYRVAVAVLACR